MKQAVTLKMRITLTAEDALLLQETMRQFALGCQLVSQYVFDHEFVLDQYALHEALYRQLRTESGLKAQMAQSAIRLVVGNYKTVQTQMKDEPYTFQDRYTGAWTRCPRDLTWLRQPLQYRQPQLKLVRNRDWSWLQDGRLSLNTLAKRIRVTPHVQGFEQYLAPDWKLGTATVVHTGGHYFLHIAATKELPAVDRTQLENIVGIDRGLRFVLVSHDTAGHTSFVSGKAITNKRAKYNRLRQQLQRKHTKSAKRRLGRLSGRENRWMSDVNHCLSKTLVANASPKTLFVVEDLTGVRQQSRSQAQARRELHSWAFFELEQFLRYKAVLAGYEVVAVSAQYTSQRCAQCGRIDETQRDRQRHEYRCTVCGYQSNDDRIAAMNLVTLGQQYVAGNNQPRFTKEVIG
ncbi:RNA-guided endonuclease InsQ/TnpB family protein [Lacticaseibacillus baoqingensis]|uniref:RNA-guided endonuclease InsQ/TnpB family protein n=1 Tax=Lacticaseibacillus baoqingensis TaxID=2486013 RepID=UPI000F775D02|nr:RNA-guided endonuclease TnpB family protein [Lacticaseibacillus baoqingensis]